MRKFKFKNTDPIFFCSDTHFYHKNIIRYCNRPYNSIEEMNTDLINKWNSVVPQDGIVFHLGDFSFCGSDKLTNILSQLNGHIILIKGNHDHFQDSMLNKFEDVYSQLHIEVNKTHVYLNHYPFLTFSGAYRDGDVVQLFGHVHSGPVSYGEGKDYSRLKTTFYTQLDVGVDNWNYTPVSWPQVQEAIAWQKEHHKLWCDRFKKDSILNKLKNYFKL